MELERDKKEKKKWKRNKLGCFVRDSFTQIKKKKSSKGLERGIRG